MQLEEGKFYKTRDGRKVGPMVRWAGDSEAKHPFEFTSECNYEDLLGEIWEVDGTSLYNDGKTIIAEWTDEPERVTVSRVEYIAGVGNVRVILSNGMELYGVNSVECDAAFNDFARATLVLNVM